MRIEDKQIKNFVASCLRGDKRRGFTLIEIVVVIGLLVIVIFFVGNIFKASIGSYRTAMAQAEIMQKLRAITQQLDSDFRGLRKDAPMFIWFQKDPNDVNNRLDQIMFFADGDFQSTRTYNGKTIVGNVARIYYGQTQSSSGLPNKDRIFARRPHISTADEGILPVNRWPDLALTNFDTVRNDGYEYDWVSLSQWQAIAKDPTIPLKVDQIINVCFGSRPAIDLADSNTLHLLMAEGVGSFSVQWSYNSNLPDQRILWWPSNDPDGNGDFSDSDFGPLGMNLSSFGFYFNSAAPTGWFSPDGVLPDGAKGTYYPAVKPAYPQALKFTFTIYDSRGVFKEGQTFTHIVYLGE